LCYRCAHPFTASNFTNSSAFSNTNITNTLVDINNTRIIPSSHFIIKPLNQIHYSLFGLTRVLAIDLNTTGKKITTCMCMLYMIGTLYATGAVNVDQHETVIVLKNRTAAAAAAAATCISTSHIISLSLSLSLSLMCGCWGNLISSPSYAVLYNTTYDRNINTSSMNIIKKE
jgi:hypothetical protein